MTEIEKRAWELYCEAAKGSPFAKDFWWELPPSTQRLFLDKVLSGTQ